MAALARDLDQFEETLLVWVRFDLEWAQENGRS